MFVKCSTCLESISPSEDLSSAPCGHVFHYTCILQWLNTGKATCPQCRYPCKESQLRKIFFSESDDIGEKTDANELQSRIDSLTFNLRIAEKESKKHKAEAQDSAAKAQALREEFRELEREKAALNGKIVDLKTQIRYFQAESEQTSSLRSELKGLKESLKLYQNVEVIVKGSLPEVNKKLHEIGDYSQASKELGILLVALKRELEASKGDSLKFKAESRRYGGLVKELKASLSLQSKEAKELNVAYSTLASDLKHAEQEKESLKARIETLKDAMDSPSGNVHRSAVNRIMSELPLPQGLEETQFTTPSPLKVKTKSCNLIGLKRDSDLDESQNEESIGAKRPCPSRDFNIFKGSRLNGTGRGIVGVFSQLEAQSYNNVREKFYNGLGGHDKLEVFPSSSSPKTASVNGKNVPKRPRKGLAKIPLGGNQALNRKTAQSIDKYFNLDTP